MNSGPNVDRNRPGPTSNPALMWLPHTLLWGYHTLLWGYHALLCGYHTDRCARVRVRVRVRAVRGKVWGRGVPRKIATPRCGGTIHGAIPTAAPNFTRAIPTAAMRGQANNDQAMLLISIKPCYKQR